MDTSPTALFDSYEQDFLQFIEVIREKLDTTNSEDVRTGKPYCGVDEVDSPSFLDQKRSTLSRVDRELDEADEMASHPIPNAPLLC
jgi:vesicle transport through interaction with t-SNAREs protein 1